MGAPILRLDEAAWRDAEDERAFWQEHHAEFLAKYTDQFVVVKDGLVVATSYDLRDLVGDLREQGLDLKQTWLHFFASESAVAIL